MRILPNYTRITQVRGNTWALEVVWRPSWLITHCALRLLLDRHMLALPAQSQDYRPPTLGVSLTGPAVGIPLNEVGVVVSENRKSVEFQVDEISLCSGERLVAKTIF